jgi:hypothetical protein
MLLVLQVYFWNYTGSPNNPNTDTQSRITNYGLDSILHLPSGLVYQFVLSPLSDLCINCSVTVLKPSEIKMDIVLRSVLVVGSLF